MIRSRRSAHLWIMSALALILPPLTLLALLKRPEIPAVASTAEPLFADEGLIGIPGGARVLAQFHASLEGTYLSLELARDQEAGHLQLTASSRGALKVAEPLLYWRPLGTSTKQLASAQLLGSISGPGAHRFVLPDIAQVAFRNGQPGQLLIVSPLVQHPLAVIMIPMDRLAGANP